MLSEAKANLSGSTVVAKLVIDHSTLRERERDDNSARQDLFQLEILEMPDWSVSCLVKHVGEEV